MAASGFPRGVSDDDDDWEEEEESTSTRDAQHKKRGKQGSGGLVPSKSTVYVSNLDFSLTNSDLYTIFSKMGKVGKVTVMKDRVTRQSKGVAFILFTAREDAEKAVKAMDGVVLNKRTLKVSIAQDNGRAREFIRRKVYKDKSRCYECGEDGHLSYECPKNKLFRERPCPKKQRRGQKDVTQPVDDPAESEDEEGEEQEEAPAPEGWASIVDTRNTFDTQHTQKQPSRGLKGPRKSSGYFSDESDHD
ncbi:U11/U12 small nuclear ribonucleoprotein 31 kDa protein [Selaginella moellendorffii]|uniref:U11/U12 small nuclear ribonucleoprotein 31 kDa protein n=1 Tax=Selaginella moellendorffii TaxID=88036 RepID=UPI000D1CCD53|nr:U11/U12 small nuclear ribonucleoprotein 31 kDa protein [Selaginella moellendorffii]|eukprot:XP_002992520.2 U11/U12 small nuclear ribonucleoprotein 31 kDa protein [Selaginella moellendorffii]